MKRGRRLHATRRPWRARLGFRLAMIVGGGLAIGCLMPLAAAALSGPPLSGAPNPQAVETSGLSKLLERALAANRVHDASASGQNSATLPPGGHASVTQSITVNVRHGETKPPKPPKPPKPHHHHGYNPNPPEDHHHSPGERHHSPGNTDHSGQSPMALAALPGSQGQAPGSSSGSSFTSGGSSPGASQPASHPTCVPKGGAGVSVNGRHAASAGTSPGALAVVQCGPSSTRSLISIVTSQVSTPTEAIALLALFLLVMAMLARRQVGSWRSRAGSAATGGAA